MFFITVYDFSCTYMYRLCVFNSGNTCSKSWVCHPGDFLRVLWTKRQASQSAVSRWWWRWWCEFCHWRWCSCWRNRRSQAVTMWSVWKWTGATWMSWVIFLWLWSLAMLESDRLKDSRERVLSERWQSWIIDLKRTGARWRNWSPSLMIGRLQSAHLFTFSAGFNYSTEAVFFGWKHPLAALMRKCLSHGIKVWYVDLGLCARSISRKIILLIFAYVCEWYLDVKHPWRI